MQQKVLLTLSLMGLAFSGYLSGVKLFTKTCAFGETCPIFLGLPACYFGFAMFLMMTIVASLWTCGKMTESCATRWMSGVSALGILFAGYFTFGELPKLFDEGLTAYMLGLPTCALGLIFYVIIFVIAFKRARQLAV